MSQASPLLHVAEGFYSAALGLVGWDHALERLGSALTADHLILTGGGQVPFLATCRVDERDLARAILAAGHLDDEGIRIADIGVGQVVIRSALLEDRRYARTRHYNEVVRPIGGFHSLFGVGTDSEARLAINVCRAPRRPDFTPEEATSLAVLMPHLSLACRIAADKAGRTADNALIEAVAGAVLVCDTAGRLTRTNSAARTLLDGGDGLAVSGGGLIATQPGETQRLRLAIKSVQGSLGRRMLLERSAGRASLSLRIVPVEGETARLDGLGAVAIFVSDPQRPEIDLTAFAESFRLTPRETQIVGLISTGLSLARIAAQCRLQVGSVRIYLKRIFDKTGARSQAALVALVRGYL